MDIEDTHPLKFKARVEHILPICKRCKKKEKPSFKHSMRLALLSELDLPAPENDEEIEEDPFLLLGYGLNAYFDVLVSAMNMFLVLSIASAPLLWYYSNNGVNELAAAGGLAGALGQFSLGNMGGARALCEHKRLNSENLVFSCPAGLIFDFERVEYGLMSNALAESNYCMERAIWNETANAGKEKCSDKLDKNKVQQQLEACKSASHKSCKLSLKDLLTQNTDQCT